MHHAPSNKTTVAEFLAEHVERSGMSHADIANDAGFLHPRMIEIMCDGRAKVPINKVLPLANTLGINTAEFCRRVLAEYAPDLLPVVIALFDDAIPTGNPMAFERAIDMLRAKQTDVHAFPAFDDFPQLESQ